MARAERLHAKEEGRARRTLLAIDYVLGVSDLTGQGALRLALTEGGEFLATPDAAAIPPLVELPRSLAAAQGFLDDPDSVEDLRAGAQDHGDACQQDCASRRSSSPGNTSR